MKKLISVIIIILFTLPTFSQWKLKHFVDDFGDEVEDTYRYLIAEGTFENSATFNSQALYKIIDLDDALRIEVYEYGTHLATSTEGTFEKLKIKKPSGEIVVIDSVFFSKEGYLYTSRLKYDKFMDAIHEKGIYKIIFKKSNRSFDSHYKMQFTIIKNK